MPKFEINATARTRPTFWVDLNGERVPVGVPSLDKLEEIIAGSLEAAEMQIEDSLTEEQKGEVFALFACILSTNYNYTKYTAEDLRARDITVAQVFDYLTEYANFIYSLADAKN